MHMDTFWKTTARAAGGLILAAALAAAQATIARPGTVNYSEGQVTVDGSTVGSQSLGKVEVQPGQVLETQQGKAEVLLTPGVLLRVDDNSDVRMVAAGLTDTRVEVLRGEALLEVGELRKENHIVVVVAGAGAEVADHGLYRFDANTPAAAVFDGKLRITQNDRTIELGKGKQVLINSTGLLAPVKFDRDRKDGLYQWSSVRSQYMAEANAASVRTLVVAGPGWYGPGWYWNSWYSTWAFVPGAGYWASPFGYNFYSPAYWRVAGPVVVAPRAVPNFYARGMARAPGFRR